MIPILFNVKACEGWVKAKTREPSRPKLFIDNRLWKRVKAVNTLSNITTHARTRTRAPRKYRNGIHSLHTHSTYNIQLSISHRVT